MGDQSVCFLLVLKVLILKGVSAECWTNANGKAIAETEHAANSLPAHAMHGRTFAYFYLIIILEHLYLPKGKAGCWRVFVAFCTRATQLEEPG